MLKRSDSNSNTGENIGVFCHVFLSCTLSNCEMNFSSCIRDAAVMGKALTERFFSQSYAFIKNCF